MLKQVKIICDPNHNNIKKGEFFEDLLRKVFYSQRYSVSQRINFTGMEIDLIAKHKDRDETIYIECKAKEALSSKEIKSFAFNVSYHHATYGYFLSVIDYSHQVAGLIEEMGKDTRYGNLYFWGPDKIFELLEASNAIQPLTTIDSEITLHTTKIILVYTYFGAFFVLVTNRGTIPTNFYIFDATDINLAVPDKDIAQLVKEIPELEDLSHMRINEKKSQASYETIAEVQESEDWADYRPASVKHFVGRKDVNNELFKFIKQTTNGRTNLRVFYIDGKSGWGKSSLINALKGRLSTANNKNKYFMLAIDTRSANTGSFVALSFNKLITLAYENDFIKDDLFIGSQVQILSTYDILASSSVQALLSSLTNVGKTLVLVFDQFEDVFRKEDLFGAFHKFLLDVNDIKANLVVGFSWKSEINIPIDNRAYSLWQQSKDIARCVTLREFNSPETNAIIKQLEEAVGYKIDIDLKRRLIESSQGFPWLIKKLCIHVFKQLKSGNTVQDLVEQDLNCEILFKEDLEDLTPDELRSLKFIAKKAYDGNFFDAIEVDEKVSNEIITALINKRLVIKSGSKYNIYWDIFRDYLVTESVPPIGESYLIRKDIGSCIKVYLILSEGGTLNINEINSRYQKVSEGTLDNTLRELRSIGLIKKSVESYSIKRLNVNNEESLKEYLKSKLSKHSVYISLANSNKDLISLTDIKESLKQVFKLQFNEKTWIVYSKLFINWLSYVGLDFQGRLKAGLVSAKHSNVSTFTPQKKPEKDIKLLEAIIKKEKLPDFKIIRKEIYDLKSFGLLDCHKENIALTDKGERIASKLGSDSFMLMIAQEVMKTRKIKLSCEIVSSNPKISQLEFTKKIQPLIMNITAPTYKNATIRRLFAWAKYIINPADKYSSHAA